VIFGCCVMGYHVIGCCVMGIVRSGEMEAPYEEVSVLCARICVYTVINDLMLY
jgi:hypothetical protein